jgi:dTDP-4-dehydrorhamnose 3,5-epimerase
LTSLSGRTHGWSAAWDLFQQSPWFGHGFAALEDSTFIYKCTAHYAPEYEGGIRWDDQELNIDWQIESPIISEKDRNLPTFAEFRNKIGIV